MFNELVMDNTMFEVYPYLQVSAVTYCPIHNDIGHGVYC